MASAPEVPMPLFFEQSSSFCSSLKNELDNYIDGIGNSFLSIDRSVKVAPKQQRKKAKNIPGSCTLDLKEFAASKQNVLHKLQTSFEQMEQKWYEDIAQLKGWFLQKIETSLSEIQLEIKLSAADINLGQPVLELELLKGGTDGDCSPDVDEMTAEQLPDQSSAHATNSEGPSHSNCLASEKTAAFGPSDDVEINGFQSSLSAAPRGTRKFGRKGAVGRTQMKKGTNVTQLSEEISSDSSIPQSTIYEPALKSRRLEQQDNETSVELCRDVGTEVTQEETDSVSTTTPLPASKKMSKKETARRIQMKKGSKSAHLSEKEMSHDSSGSNPSIDEQALRIPGQQCIDRHEADELVPVPSPPPVSSPPLANTKRMGKTRAAGRAPARRGVKDAQLSEKQTAGNSAIDETDLNSNHIPQQNVPALHEASPSPPPPVNIKKSRRGAASRAPMKKGSKNPQLSGRKAASDSGNEPDLTSNVNTNLAQQNMNSLNRAIPPVNSKKVGRRGAATKTQLKKGVIDTEEIEIVSDIPNSGINEPPRSGRVPELQDIGSNGLPETMVLSGPHPVANTKRAGKTRSGKATAKRGAADVLETGDKETVCISGIPESGFDIQDFTVSGETYVLQENMPPHHRTSPPTVNTKKTGKRGAVGRAQMKKVAKDSQLNKKEITGVSSIAHSVVDEPPLRSGMSDWQGLLSAVENAPCRPGLFEVKVWRAKKSAYIGHTHDLQKSVSLYREGLPSGEKHLDQFVKRNKDEISVRYEVYPSVQLAKLEQTKKLKEFLDKYKNLPSYNYGI